MNDSVSVIGIGMTPMSTRDLSPSSWRRWRPTRPWRTPGSRRPRSASCSLPTRSVDQLNNQACIRGQAWLQPLGLDGVGVINVDNSCASGASAFHLGVMAAERGRVARSRRRYREDVDRVPAATLLAAIEEGLPLGRARGDAREATARSEAPSWG